MLEGDLKVDMLELMKKRRSIRKYEQKPVSFEDLERIIEAGLFAPNAGGRQGTYIVGIQNPEITAHLGRLNRSIFTRSNLTGNHVSNEQPSIIDDPTIKNAFYDAPTICALFGPDNFLHSEADAYCCAENMVLMASSLGLASCIIARGKETFVTPEGRKLMDEWGVPTNYSGECFVLLGYCRGEYPHEKPRKPGRFKIIA